MINTSLLKKLAALPFTDITLTSGYNVTHADVVRTVELLAAQRTGKKIQRKRHGEWVDSRITPSDVVVAYAFRVSV